MRIRSQRGPEYAPHVNCTVYVDTHTDTTVWIDATFVTYDLGYDAETGSCLDHVQLFSDRSLTASLTPKICNRGGPRSFFISQGHFVLQFVTGPVGRSGGFELFYRSYDTSGTGFSRGITGKSSCTHVHAQLKQLSPSGFLLVGDQMSNHRSPTGNRF